MTTEVQAETPLGFRQEALRTLGSLLDESADEHIRLSAAKAILDATQALSEGVR